MNIFKQMDSSKKSYSSVSDLVKRKIEASLISHVYHQAYLGQFTSLFCATVIMISLNHTTNPIITAWYTIFVAIIFLRMGFAKFYLVQKNPEQNLRLWRNLLILGALLGGLAWGATGSLIFSYANSNQQTLIILIVAGITAGASPLLSAELTSSLVFLSMALLPLIFRLGYFGDNTTYSLFSITVVAYFIYLIVISFKLHKTMREAIALKFENDILLDNLSHAKDQLEISNQKLVEVATHDPLTNAANRSLFETTFLEAIARAKVTGRVMALLYIDLDNFKEVNDAYGHAVGDGLLLSVVQRLRKNVRESDTIARLGGDELIIILENILDPEIIFSIAKLLCSELSKSYTIQEHTIAITASIGVSIYPLDGVDAVSLLKIADSAMYYVKENGRNNYRFSVEAMTKREILNEVIKARINDKSA
jgi:diguanylate cyclase (GGDEF)-like protein